MPQDRPVLLVVEDDFLVRLTLVDGLEDGGFEVLEAGDAQEALALLCDRSDIGAMLTDINLPGGSDGFALARAARVLRPELPVVYASGRYQAVEKGRGVPGALFLPKPFTPSAALDALSMVLDRARPPAPSAGVGHASPPAGNAD